MGMRIKYRSYFRFRLRGKRTVVIMLSFLKQAPGTSLEKGKSKKSETIKEKKHIPWVEKYRPKTIDDVAHQEETVAVLKKSLQGADLPNLLFYGPPGTGKTSTILAAARELFGNEMFKLRVLELNASDERGINVVREKVKRFSQLSASAKRPDGKPCPPYKIIILDEADSMTSAAQSALRRTMEKESKTTRFCLICNYVSRIIEPITSRCAKFRFKPLGKDILQEKLNLICEKEGVNCSSEAIEALEETSEGDMRKAITTLQSAFRLKAEEEITQEDIYEMSGVMHKDIIENIYKVCHSASYEQLDTTIREIMLNGHSAVQIITQIHDFLINQHELNDKQKSTIFEKIAVADKCLIDGADEYLQVMDVCTTIMTQICHAK